MYVQQEIFVLMLSVACLVTIETEDKKECSHGRLLVGRHYSVLTCSGYHRVPQGLLLNLVKVNNFIFELSSCLAYSESNTYAI